MQTNSKGLSHAHPCRAHDLNSMHCSKGTRCGALSAPRSHHAPCWRAALEARLIEMYPQFGGPLVRFVADVSNQMEAHVRYFRPRGNLRMRLVRLSLDDTHPAT